MKTILIRDAHDKWKFSLGGIAGKEYRESARFAYEEVWDIFGKDIGEMCKYMKPGSQIEVKCSMEVCDD